MAHQNSLNNLKPFTGANDPRRQNGRQKGQVNRKTAIKNLLNSPIDPKMILNPSTREKLNKYGLKDKTYLEVIAYVLANQAINGEIQASRILLNELHIIEEKEPPESFQQQELRIITVSTSEELKALEAKKKRLEARYGKNYDDLID